jgi:type I restriction enzyme M protein
VSRTPDTAATTASRLRAESASSARTSMISRCTSATAIFSTRTAAALVGAARAGGRRVDAHIARLTQVYGNFRDGETERVPIDGTTEERVVSRIFENREFGFLKVTVERPLRLNFEASAERIARLDEQSAFEGLAVSKKRKDARAVEAEEAAGREQQEVIRAMLATLERKGRYMDRDRFEANLSTAAKRARVNLPTPIKKAIFTALGERDPNAAICTDGKGQPEPDSELSDTENIPLPPGTPLQR